MADRDGVHLWCASLEEVEVDTGVLSTGELARAERFRMEKHRRSFLVRHALLRTLLGEWLDTDPRAIELDAGADGKPFLPDFPDVHFSLSSSHGMALVGVSRDAPIGVDVERITPLPDLERIAARFFAPDESRRLLELPPEERQAFFFHLWARKEAYGKAVGSGLAELGVRLDGDPPSGWALESLSLDGDFAGAVAWWTGGREPDCAPLLTRLPRPSSAP